MNIHPLFVHFPIALLSLYSVLELLSFGRWGRSPQLLWTKTLLSIVGTISAFITLQTGEMAEHLMGRDTSLRNVVEMHSTFANIATYVYALIAACYLIRMLQNTIPTWTWNASVLGWLVALQRFVLHPVTAKLLAVVGLVGIVVASALGGSLVYGPDADPFVSFIYHLFFPVTATAQ